MNADTIQESEKTASRTRRRRGHGRRLGFGLVVIATAPCLWSAQATAAGKKPGEDEKPPSSATLEETRLVMGKWIETQQILSKERSDWQQGHEILQGRLEVVKKEMNTLKEKLDQARASAAEADKKKAAFVADRARLKEIVAQLAQVVTGLESEIRSTFKSLPEPVQSRLQPLYGRIPEDPASTRISVAERYQSVLGILNELNKANNDIAQNYEVRTLSDGKSVEVRVLYIGLAQAYYVSASGEAGIGRPTPEGWMWEPSKAVGGDVTTALEIMQGKHTPAFVPLPVKVR